MFFKFKLPKDTIKASFKDSKGRPLIPIWYETKESNYTNNRPYRRNFSRADVCFNTKPKTDYVFNKLMKDNNV